jgi:hypothetical protein
MGTPIAVAYAILVAFYMEDPITQDIEAFKRFIDDIVAFGTRERLQRFVDDFNKRDPSRRIKLEAVHIARDGVFLDLHLYFTEDGKLGHYLHEKENNAKQYIAPFSSHAKHVLGSSGWVRGGFRRIALNCTTLEEQAKAIITFTQQLVKRGYDLQLIQKARHGVPSRATLIAQLRRRQEIKKATQGISAKPKGPILVVKLPNIKRSLHLRELGRGEERERLVRSRAFRETYADSDLIVGYKNHKAMGRYVTRSRFVRK